VNDLIGSGGMLRGWAMLWHMEIMWLLPMLVVSVAAVALVELLISSRGWHLSLGVPRLVDLRQNTGIIRLSPSTITQFDLEDSATGGVGDD
jgi:hypothetical protein